MKRRPQKKLQKSLVSLVIPLFLLLSFWILESADTPTPPTAGAPPQIFANEDGDDLTKAMTIAIDSAEHSVVLAVYSLTDRQIIASLRNKSLQGVDVFVLCDASATSPFDDSTLGPNVKVVRRFGPGLMHLKTLVIDGRKTWIGSANMTRDSLRYYGNLILAIDNPFLADMIEQKVMSLGVEGHGPAFPDRAFDTGGQLIDLWFLPDNKHASLKLKTLMRSAKKTIRVAMFTWTRQDFAKTVIDASKRGVDVEVVIDQKSGKGASQKVVAMLKKQGINVRLSRGGPLLHHKFLYIDGETLISGSANWTHRAFTANDDCFTVLHALLPEQRDKMDALWKSMWRSAAKN